MELRLVALFLSLLSIAHSVPLNNWESNRCSKQCSLSKQNFNYEIGKTYVYKYDTNTRLVFANGNDQEVAIRGKVFITVVDACDFALQLGEIDVKGPEYFDQSILKEHPIMFSFDDGRITNVCPSAEDDQFAVNLKKGILSALQVSMRNLEGSNVLTETDILGQCETVYDASQSQELKGILIRKKKDSSSCIDRHQSLISLFPRKYYLPDQSIHNTPFLSNQYNCDIVVKKDIIQSSICVDKNTLLPLKWSNAASYIQSNLKLEFQQLLPIQKVSPPRTLTRHSLLYATSPLHQSEGQELNAMNIVRELCNQVSNDLQPETAKKFTQLVYELRHLSASAITGIYNDVMNDGLCSSRKIKDMFGDAMVMAGNEGSIKVLTDLINREQVSKAKAYYWTFMLIFNNHVTEKTIAAALPLLKKNYLQRQATLAISSMIHNYCHNPRVNCESSETIKQAIETIVSEFDGRCGTTNVAEREKIVVALKAISNIGRTQYSTKKVLNCVETANVQPVVQVAAIESLENDASEKRVQTKMMQLFKDQNQPTEVRIAAYKIIMKSPQTETIRTLVQLLNEESSQQVGAYVLSHMENVLESSDPVKRSVRNVLESENLPTDKFAKDVRKYSRYFEFSQHISQLNLGGNIEGDIIYDNSFLARSLILNASVFAQGNHLNLFKVHLRQKGLENTIESIFGEHGLINKKSLPDIMGQLMDFFTDKANEVRRLKRESFLQRRVDLLHERVSAQSDSLEGSFSLDFDGKTIIHFTVEDLKSLSKNELKELISNYKENLNMAYKAMKGEGAFSYMFIDTTQTLPTINGMPIKADINGTAIFGYKGKDNVFSPSASLELSTKLGFEMKTSKPGVKWVNTIHTAPAVQVQVDYKNERPSRLTFSLPKEHTEVFSYRSQVYVVKANNDEEALKAETKEISGCTKQLTRILGIEACVATKVPKPFFNLNTPLIPLNGPLRFEYFIKKTDATMKGWEFTIELPKQDEQETFIYKFAFDTPNSSVKRQVSAQVQLLTPKDGSRTARLQFISPLKSFDTFAKYRWDAKELISKFDLKIDQQSHYSVEASLLKDGQDTKAQYRPKLVVRIPQRKTIQLGGTIMVDSARRSQIVIDLYSGRNTNEQYTLKGKIIKDGTNRKLFRLSSDISANLGFIVFRIVSLADKNPKSSAVDCKVEYQTPNKLKHNLRFVSKMQDASSQSLTKLSTFWEMTFTEIPEYNFHINFNLMNKLLQHMETQLIYKWGDNFNNPKKEVNILYITKIDMRRNQKIPRFSKMENQLNLKLLPFDKNYEFQINGNMEEGETPKFHVEYSAKEKQRSYESLGSFDFKHVSKKPLHLSIDAYLKYPNRELRYSDNLREQSPNEYHGKSIIQLEPNKQTSIDYKYRIKSDGHRLTHHEFDFDLKTPTMRYPSKHAGLLRMSPNEFEFATKFDHNGRNIWDCKSLLSKQRPSMFELDTPMLNARLDSDHVVQKTTSLNINGKTFALQHNTDVAYPAKQLSFTTKTIYKNKPILKVSSMFTKPRSKLSLNSSPMNINFDYDTISQPLVGKLEIRSNDHPSYHLTSVLSQNGKTNLKSETKWKNDNVALVESSLAQDQDSYLNIDTPHLKSVLSCSSLRNPVKTARIQVKGVNYPLHLEGQFTSKPNEYSINSLIKHNNQPVVDINSVFSKNSDSNLIWKTKNYAGRVDVSPFQNTKTLSLNFKDNRNILDHSTKLEVSPTRWGFNTRTSGLQNKYKSFALNGHLDDKSSHLKMKLNQATGTFELQPYHGLALEVNGDKLYPIYHNTIIRRLPKRFELVSNTEHKGKKFFKVESMLHSDAKSTVKMETQTMNANLNYEPTNEKNVHFTLNSVPHLIDHDTKVTWTPKQVKIDSLTNKNYEQYAKLNSILSRAERSHVKVIGKPFEASLEFDPTVEHKLIKFNYAGKLSPCEHTTSLTYHPSEFNLNSQTFWENRPFVSLKGKLTGQSNSFLDWKSNNLETNLNVSPYGREKSVDLMVNKKYGTPIVHKTKIILVPSESINVHTQTHKNAQQLYLVDSKLSKVEPSQVLVSTVPWNVNLKVDPINEVKKFNFAIKGRHLQVDHSTDLTYEPRRRVDLNSQTTHASNNVYLLKSSWQKYGESNFDLDTQPINCQLKLNPYSQVKNGELNFKHKNSDTKLWAKVDYNPMKSLKVLSKADQATQTLYNLDSHLKSNDNSYLNIDFPKSYAKFEVNPYRPLKTAQMQWNAKDSSYAHQFTGSLDNNALKTELLSSKYGKTWAQLKTEISRQKASNAQFVVPNWTGQLNVDPYSNPKSLNWKLNSAENEISHDTSIKHQPGNLLLNSVTNYKNSPYLKINSNILNQGKSYFNYEAPETKLNIDFDPYAQEKYGKFYFHSLPTYRHITQARISPKKWFLETETKKDGNKLFALKTNLENRLASVSCDNPLFKTKLDVDLNGKTNINLNYLARHSNNRRILCSFNRLQDKQLRNEYSLDLKWNADQNPTDSFNFRLATYLNEDAFKKLHHIEFDGQLFNSYSAKVRTKCNYEDAVHGPHEIDITLTTPRDTKQLILTHELVQNKCKCSATLFKNGLQITKVQNTIEYYRNTEKFLFNEDFSIVSKSKSIDGVKFTLSHIYSKDKIDTLLKSDLPDFKPILIHLKTGQSINNYNGLISVELIIDTPLSDFKHQTLTFSSEWDKNKGDGKLYGQFISNFGKKIKLNGNLKISSNDQSSLSLDCDSDIEQVPDVKLNANLINQQKRKGGQFNIDYTGKRIVDINALVQLQNDKRFDGDVDFDTEWTPRLKVNAYGEKTSDKLDYMMSMKRDDDEFFGAKLSGTKNYREMKGNGLIKAFGNDLLQIDMLDNNDQGLSTYDMNIRGLEDIIKVNFKKICTGEQVKHSLRVCKRSCYTFESNVYDKSSYSYYDQLASFSMKSDKSPLQYRLDYILNTKQNINNKLMATFEDKQFGYEITSGQQSMLLNIQLLDRKIEINERQENNKYIIEILPNSLKREDKFTITAQYDKQMSNYVKSLQCELKLSHPMWRQPIGIAYTMNSGEISKPYEGKLNIKYGPKDEQELIVNALFEHPNADVRNSSFTLKINDPDYKFIHFQLQAHLGSNQEVITTGFNLLWLDNQSVTHKTFFLLQANVERKQLTVTSWCPNNNLLIDGTWQIVDDVITVDGDAQLNGEERKAHIQLEFKEKPCIEVQLLKEPAIQTFKWRSCVDNEGSNILKFLSESYSGNVKSTDISLLFDRNGRNMIRGALHWKPEMISNMIYSVQNAYRTQRSNIFQSFMNDVARKWRAIRSTAYNDVARPFSNKIYYEYNKVNREILNIFEPLMLYVDKFFEMFPTHQEMSNYYENVMQQLANGVSAMIPDHLKEIFDDVLRRITRELTQTCTENSVCYSLAFSYERKGFEGLFQEAQKLSRRAYKEWKQSFLQSTGNLSRTVRNLIPPSFTGDLKDAFSSLGDALADVFRPIMNSSIFRRVKGMMYSAGDILNYYTESMFESLNNKMSEIYEGFRNNEDLRPIINFVNDAYREIGYELDKIQWNNIDYLLEQLKKVVMTPRQWIPNTRFTLWNPEQGEIAFEVRRPSYVPDLKSVWKYRKTANYATPTDFINRFRSNVYGEWVPPFKSQAMLVSGKHFITFDRKFYDFAGRDCSYLLARDFLDGNFSVMAKYNQMYDGHKVDKSIIVQSNGKNIEILTNVGQVKVDDKEVELPLFLGKTTVIRQGETIIVDDKHGIIVECLLSHDICTVSVAGWYFGKTAGLFGTYDYEPENDMRLPKGKLAKNVEDFATGWEVRSNCQTQNQVRHVELSPNSYAYEECEYLLNNQNSPLRVGFGVINPKDFFKMCLRHTSVVKRQEIKKSVCTIVAAYVKALRFNHVNINLPSQCLSCDKIDYGSRKLLKLEREEKTADVVFVIEEHECNRPLVSQIKQIADLIDRQLTSVSNIRNNRFAVVGYAGDDQDGLPHWHTSRGQLLYPSREIALAVDNINYRRRYNRYSDVDTFEAIRYASEFKWRKGASKTLVLLSCTPCQEKVSRLDYSDIQRLLLSEGITLHVLNDKRIEINKRYSSKNLNIYGIDAMAAYNYKDLSSMNLHGQRDLRRTAIVSKDVCIALAHESRGSYFTTLPVINEGTGSDKKSWRSLLAKRIEKTASPEMRQECECVLDRDGLHSKSICRPSKPWRPLH